MHFPNKTSRIVSHATVLLLAAMGLSIWERTGGAEEGSEEARAQRAALGRFQQYIGEWRGVGQPKRGSAKDAWSEECQWAWSFHDKTAALSLVSPNGKYLREPHCVANQLRNTNLLPSPQTVANCVSPAARTTKET